MKIIAIVVVFLVSFTAKADYWMTFCKTPGGRQYSQVGYVKPDDDGFVTVKAGQIKSNSTDGYLVLAGQFYDEIEAGTKTVEYRDFSKYNLKRTIGITTVRFNRGYGHPGQPPAQMCWEVEKVVFQDAADNECDPMTTPDGFVPVRIAIYLGKRI